MPVPQSRIFLWNRHLACCGHYEQARCLFHNPEFSCGTGILPVAAIMNRQDARSTIQNFLVQQASCLLRTIWNGQDARSTIKQFLVEQASCLFLKGTTSTPMNKAH
ncbi:hypothetical protein [Microcoleus sp. A003_D6]|uniref:hypothetical protein n=1 Tax=Microcoleus sp. A003_D6 TaxID=3055266 RepID=UPI002FD708F4